MAERNLTSQTEAVAFRHTTIEEEEDDFDGNFARLDPKMQHMFYDALKSWAEMRNSKELKYLLSDEFPDELQGGTGEKRHAAGNVLASNEQAEPANAQTSANEDDDEDKIDDGENDNDVHLLTSQHCAQVMTH